MGRVRDFGPKSEFIEFSIKTRFLESSKKVTFPRGSVSRQEFFGFTAGILEMRQNMLQSCINRLKNPVFGRFLDLRAWAVYGNSGNFPENYRFFENRPQKGP